MKQVPWRTVLAFVFLVAAGGCSVGQLDDVVLLAHGSTPDTCQKFKRNAGYGDNHLLPAFKEVEGNGHQNIACDKPKEEMDTRDTKSSYFPAIEMHYGDKFTVRQIAFGLGITGNTTPRDRRPPTISGVTISLRKIAKDGFLSDEEEQFLYAILAVSRADMFGGVDVKNLADELAKPGIARAMWNAMPKALRLINVRENDAQRERWQLTISIAVLCKAFGERHGDTTQFASAFNFEGGSVDNVCNSKDFYSIGLGLAGFQHPAGASAFKAATPAKSRYFDRLGVSGTFEFVEVEVRGVSMRNPFSPESKWSLKEWQEAGICKLESSSSERAVIRRLKLRGAPPVNWMTVIHGEPTEPKATHEVQITYLPTYQTGPRRDLKKLRGGYPYLINDNDLDKLRLSDIAEIEWGGEPDKGAWRAPKWSGAVTPQCEPWRGSERHE